MRIRVVCIDAEKTGNTCLLEKGRYYTVKKITATYRRSGRRGIFATDLFYQLKEIPSFNFNRERFKVVGKINISLPDDIYNLPLI